MIYMSLNDKIFKEANVVFVAPAKRHIGITLSSVHLSVCHTLLLLAPHWFRRNTVINVVQLMLSVEMINGLRNIQFQ